MGYQDTPPPPQVTSNLEEFLALVAHEVRTPLVIAKNAAESVLGDRGDTDAELAQRTELLEMIERNIDLAVLLLDRVGLARSVESDSLELAREPVDLDGLVRQAVEDLRTVVLGDRPVGVSAAGRLVAEVDPTTIREIIFNLLSNAAKYSEPGAPIDVTIEERGGCARIVVRDHGSGVNARETERIFGKFFQGDDGSAGVGLGLFISRGLARAHGGDLNVRPAAGRGSEFVLSLPLRD